MRLRIGVLTVWMEGRMIQVFFSIGIIRKMLMKLLVQTLFVMEIGILVLGDVLIISLITQNPVIQLVQSGLLKVPFLYQLIIILYLKHVGTMITTRYCYMLTSMVGVVTQ